MVHALLCSRHLRPPSIQHHCRPLPLMLDVSGKYFTHLYPHFCRVFPHDGAPTLKASMDRSRMGFGLLIRLINTSTDLPLRWLHTWHHNLHHAPNLKAQCFSLLLPRWWLRSFKIVWRTKIKGRKVDSKCYWTFELHFLHLKQCLRSVLWIQRLQTFYRKNRRIQKRPKPHHAKP